jgi:hypothetical protein
MRPLNVRIGGVENGSPACCVPRGRDFLQSPDPRLRELQRRVFFFQESYRTVVQTHARSFSSVVSGAVQDGCHGYKWTARLAIGVRDVW